MAHELPPRFNLTTFLAKVNGGKRILQAKEKEIIFSQGDAADAVFYIQEGRIKLTVLSAKGKEAVIAILELGAFFWEILPYRTDRARGNCNRPGRVHHPAHGQAHDDPHTARRAHPRGAVHHLSPHAQPAHRIGLGGSAL